MKKSLLTPFMISKVPTSSYLEHDYYQKIVKFIKSKQVLDVGCTQHDINKANTTRLWNHWFIYNLASNVVGIDIDVKSLNSMKQMGFNVETMDAEKISFQKQFDTIFAGELIEHLVNPGQFLVSASGVIKKNGYIVLSTPNTYSLSRIFRVFQKFTNDPPVNPDHTTYYTPATISTLIHKCGLKIFQIEYAHFPFTCKSPFIMLNIFLCYLLGERFKEQLIVVITKK